MGGGERERDSCKRHTINQFEYKLFTMYNMHVPDKHTKPNCKPKQWERVLGKLKYHVPVPMPYQTHHEPDNTAQD